VPNGEAYEWSFKFGGRLLIWERFVVPVARGLRVTVVMYSSAYSPPLCCKAGLNSRCRSWVGVNVGNPVYLAMYVSGDLLGEGVQTTGRI
jgi:hypothetical protein